MKLIKSKGCFRGNNYTLCSWYELNLKCKFSPQNDKIKKFSELKRQGLEFSKTQRKILTSDTTSMLVVGRSGTGKATIVSFKS